MAWHRDSIGLLIEKFVFSLLSFLTVLLVSINLTEIEEDQQESRDGEIYGDDYEYLYTSMIPAIVLVFFIVLKVIFQRLIMLIS